MAKDDRFTVFVVITVTLLTAAIFVATHWDAPTFAGRSENAERIVVEPSHPVTGEVAPASTDEAAQEEIMPAVYNPDSSASSVAAVASDSRRAAADDGAMAVLDDLASGWRHADLPTPQEILVRKDADGRMVVAAGTHRRYDRLCEDLENLDVDAVAAALDPAVVATSTDDTADLRGRVISEVNALLAVDLPEVEPDMIAGTVAWGFADDDYKDLTGAQRHLLLMGLDNARAIRPVLEDLRCALGLGEVTDAETPPEFDPGFLTIAESSPPEPPLKALIEASTEP